MIRVRAPPVGRKARLCAHILHGGHTGTLVSSCSCYMRVRHVWTTISGNQVSVINTALNHNPIASVGFTICKASDVLVLFFFFFLNELY